MKRTLTAIGALVVIQAVLVTVWLWVEMDRGRDKDSARVPKARSDSKAIGRKAPDFTFLRPDGSAGNMASFAGKSVLVHFWATWCPPCQKELPGLLEFAEKSHTVVLAVSLDKSWDNVRAFRGRQSLKHIVLASSHPRSSKLR